MNECDIRFSKIKKNHEKTLIGKETYFSNLIINKYIARNHEIGKFKDIIQPYYNIHKREFDNFSVCVMWKKIDVLTNKISVPGTITVEKQHLFNPCMTELPIVIRVPLFDFPETFDSIINKEVDEINKIFISDLRDMAFSHYMTEPKAML